MSTICKAVAKNERRVLTVSSLHENIEGLQNVCLSLPSVVGAEGVGNTLQPSLSADELKNCGTAPKSFVRFSSRPVPSYLK